METCNKIRVQHCRWKLELKLIYNELTRYNRHFLRCCKPSKLCVLMLDSAFIRRPCLHLIANNRLPPPTHSSLHSLQSSAFPTSRTWVEQQHTTSILTLSYHQVLSGRRSHTNTIHVLKKQFQKFLWNSPCFNLLVGKLWVSANCGPSSTFYWVAQHFLLWAVSFISKSYSLRWLRGISIGCCNNY